MYIFCQRNEKVKYLANLQTQAVLSLPPTPPPPTLRWGGGRETAVDGGGGVDGSLRRKHSRIYEYIQWTWREINTYEVSFQPD
jgi:hypothetical protein